MRLITSPDGNILEDRVVTAAGSYSATAAVNGAGWVMQLVAFRAASASGDTQPPTAPTDVAVVWKMLADNKLEPVQIRTGITDHTTTALTEVLKGELKEGDVLLTGASKERAERFSFALVVALTPLAIGREVLRLVKASHEATAAGTAIDLHGSMVTGLLGAFFAFLAGLVALKWLSSWLEEGRWYLFGIYCLVASVVPCFALFAVDYFVDYPKSAAFWFSWNRPSRELFDRLTSE